MSIPRNIIPIATGENPNCAACTLFNWPKLCRLIAENNECRLDNVYFYWTGWIAANTPVDQIVDLSGLHAKTKEEIKDAVRDKLKKANVK